MNRATLLTSQLLTFAKGGAPVKKIINLGRIVTEVVHFNLSGSKVNPTIQLADNLWLVEADQGQLEQVICNLTINARQSMPEGGDFIVTLENALISQEAIHGLAGRECVHITVADTGTGIMPDHLKRVFEPYFTTKQAGSGLGLASTYSIIQKHGGHISVESAVGQGTIFEIYFPAASDQLLPAIQKVPGTSTFKQAREALVLDDEETIRTTLAAMLKEFNFAVQTEAESQKAVELYQNAFAAGRPFDLVIVDLTIPGGMGGEEVARAILEIDPKATIVVSSGYADAPVMANYPDHGFKGMMTKPYTLKKLSTELSKVLADN